MSTLIEQMQTPSFYPHETRPPIRLIQTHVSYVLLTGLYAYKVKKPVNLGFLDYSTIEKRKHFCEEELRLNKQFSPDIYLDVAPIFAKAGAYSLHRPAYGAQPVEYAVRMRQFDDDELLLKVFERGEFDEALARRLGCRLAELHAKAGTDEVIARYGAPERVGETAFENFEALRPCLGECFDRRHFDELRTFTNDFLRDNRRLLEKRAASGKIRECHGDLHLNNVCLHEGRIELFDRIEFNDAFKNIDVMYDLAFLLMDLRYRGRVDLANIVMNTYLEWSGDYTGALLLPLYLSMRALIRAKVAALAVRDPGIPADQRARAAESAIRHFEHAYSYTRSGKGRIVLMSGLSGSGKSTVARELAKRLDGIHVRSDAVRKHLAGVALDEHGEAIYSEAFTRATYDTLTELGVLLASKGATVILDAKFDRRRARAKVFEKAAGFEVPIAIVFCRAELHTLKQRLSRRIEDVSDAVASMVDAQADAFEGFDADESQRVIEVDTDRECSVDDLLARLAAAS